MFYLLTVTTFSKEQTYATQGSMNMTLKADFATHQWYSGEIRAKDSHVPGITCNTKQGAGIARYLPFKF